MPVGVKSTQQTRIMQIGRHRVPIETTVSILADGTVYTAGSVGIPAVVIREIPEDKRLDQFREGIIKQLNGKVTEEKDLKQGPRVGKESKVQGTQGAMRLQMYMNGGFIMFAIIEARTSETLTSPNAESFFGSFKMNLQ